MDYPESCGVSVFGDIQNTETVLRILVWLAVLREGVWG